jgi:hypothetical protein
MLLPVILTIVICCDLIFTVLTQEKYERKLKAQTEDEIKRGLLAMERTVSQRKGRV